MSQIQKIARAEQVFFSLRQTAKEERQGVPDRLLPLQQKDFEALFEVTPGISFPEIDQTPIRAIPEAVVECSSEGIKVQVRRLV